VLHLTEEGGLGRTGHELVPPRPTPQLRPHPDGLVQRGLDDRARVRVTGAKHLVLHLAQQEVQPKPGVAPVAAGSVEHEIRLRRGRCVGQHRGSRRTSERIAQGTCPLGALAHGGSVELHGVVV
jgi:hypothetical protein